MPSTHEQAFLQAIVENPDDDAPRLVYADWLEEQGEAERAEFIRVQCRLAALDADAPQRRDLQRREYELLADHWGEWAGPLVGRVRRWRFHRGFIEQVKMEAGQFLKEARWLLDVTPIQHLEVVHPKVEELRALLVSRYIRRITRLDLDHARLGDIGASLLANSPNLARLRRLSLEFNEIGLVGLRALTGSQHLQSLRSIGLYELGAKRLDDRAFATFVTSCQLPSLDRLEWRGNIGPAGAHTLASAPLARQLTALRLKETHLRPEGLRVLAESSSFTQVQELAIERDEDFRTADTAQLASSPLMSRLTSLELSVVALGDEGITELTRSSQTWSALRRLDLSFNRIGPDGAQALADSPLCASLTQLVLSGNPIRNRGVKAVANSPHLLNLHRLGLYKCGITRHGVRALLSSRHVDKLTYLGLQENEIGRKAFDALHARLGERLFHEHFEDGLDGPEIIRRVKAEPPRCLRGLGARPDTERIRRFPRDRLDPAEYACVAFELTHPDPRQKAVLLGYEDTRGNDIFFSPYAVRWEPSGQQREFFDAEQHGDSGETDSNCTIVGSGKRKAWQCGRRGCRDHVFIVTFIYRIEYPPVRSADRYLPFADRFYHIDLAAYCVTQDRVIEIAAFECK